MLVGLLPEYLRPAAGGRDPALLIGVPEVAEAAGFTLAVRRWRGVLPSGRLAQGAGRGVVPVRVSGGASKVTLRRPAGTEARAEVTGGASQLAFDDQFLGAVGSRTVLASSGFADAVDRYEIRFTGGASQVTVTTT